MTDREGVLRSRPTQPHPIGYKLSDSLGTNGPSTGMHPLGFERTIRDSSRAGNRRSSPLGRKSSVGMTMQWTVDVLLTEVGEGEC
jgi:hypothetical protein